MCRRSSHIHSLKQASCRLRVAVGEPGTGQSQDGQGEIVWEAHLQLRRPCEHPLEADTDTLNNGE